MGILRDTFGPSKDEIWSRLSRQMGAEYHPDGLFRPGKIVVSYRQWELTLDTYTIVVNNVTMTFTRLRAPYVNADGFRFLVYRKSVFTWLGKMFGMQDVQIGEPRFDEEFVVQGRTETQVRNLLSNPDIRELIRKQPSIRFEVKDDEGWFGARFPEGVDELSFETLAVIKDRERLLDLFNLFAMVLDRLCLMGSAYEKPPGFRNA